MSFKLYDLNLNTIIIGRVQLEPILSRIIKRSLPPQKKKKKKVPPWVLQEGAGKKLILLSGKHPLTRKAGCSHRYMTLLSCLNDQLRPYPHVGPSYSETVASSVVRFCLSWESLFDWGHFALLGSV